MTPARWPRPLVLLAALALLVLGAGGCGPADPSTRPGAGDADPTPQPAGPGATPPGEHEVRTRAVQVYVGHAERGDPCEDVFGLDREVSTDAPLREALQALLAGPTPAEADEGYGGWFSAETEGMLLGVAVDDGTAHVDFADLSEVIPNASTSCGSALLLGQLDATVTQFDTVDEARYAFDGDQQAFYGWLQLAGPE